MNRWHILCMMGLIFLLVQSAASKPNHRRTAKHKRAKDKFVLTSTRQGNWNWNGSGAGQEEEVGGCIRIDIHVPENFDPMPLCLKRKSPDTKIAGFHKDFKLRIPVSGSSQPLVKELSIRDILTKNFAVDGYVIGLGVSFATGYFSDNAFYGTLLYRHFLKDQTIHCSILPISQLSEFVNMTKMGDERKQRFIHKKTIKKYREIGPNAIVACADMHHHRDIPSPFVDNGPRSPTNVKIPKSKTSKVPVGQKVRQKRQAPPPNGIDPPPGADGAASSDVAPPPDAGLGDNAAPPPEMGPAVSDSESAGTPKPSKQAIKANKTLSKFTKVDKHGTYYATVCYIVDASYLDKRFNGTPEQATLLLGGFVEIADWILRATDWNMDGVPDNIGMRLLEVNIQFMTKELKQMDEKWGRSPGGAFQRRSKIFNILRQAGTYMNTDCDVRSGIGEVNVAKYIIHEPGGCTACKHEFLTSFVNPYMEKYSPRGEQLRLMYHQIRVLAFAFAHTDSYCANCSTTTSEDKLSTVVASFEPGDVDWGACIVEGDGQTHSNIPLNSFRLSVCSRERGMSCFKELAARNNCLQFDPEDNYCGNGIVEGDEECDCGSLATCVEQLCTCSPRSGRNPCRKLDPVDRALCFTLIRCRGFRYLYETGQGNGSNFMPAFSTFVDGTHFRIGHRSALGDDNDFSMALKPAAVMLTLTFALIMLRMTFN